jgi:hypothetical protein
VNAWARLVNADGSDEHLKLCSEALVEVQVEQQRKVLAGLKAEFLRLLTEDSETNDRRREEYNQAIFDGERGFACFNGTDLSMVMEKFDRAVRNLK